MIREAWKEATVATGGDRCKAVLMLVLTALLWLPMKCMDWELREQERRDLADARRYKYLLDKHEDKGEEQ